ncbi:MAG: hypothetical protein AB1540_01245 [Bdellovibrionota bacterium]
MLAYRTLAQSLQQKFDLPLEASLVNLSTVMKSLAHELTPGEVRVLRMNVASELHQVMLEGHPRGSHRLERMIETVSSLLEIPFEDARNRILAVLGTLRDSTSPWDNIKYIELLDRLHAEVLAVRSHQTEVA